MLTIPSERIPTPMYEWKLFLQFIWPQWSNLIPDKDKFDEINRTVSQETHRLFNDGILPVPRNRIGSSYSDSAIKTANELWNAVHSIADDLNVLTQGRWEKVLSSSAKVL